MLCKLFSQDGLRLLEEPFLEWSLRTRSPSQLGTCLAPHRCCQTLAVASHIHLTLFLGDRILLPPGGRRCLGFEVPQLRRRGPLWPPCLPENPQSGQRQAPRDVPPQRREEADTGRCCPLTFS